MRQNKSKIIFWVLIFLTCPFRTGFGHAAQQLVYDKEKMKQDYRTFLQELKALNEQYKGITGEISEVIKEEGAPKWDMGNDSETGFKESGKDLTVILEMPGIKKDSIKITVQDGTKLTVSATRKTGPEQDRKFEKSVDLPSPVEPNGAKAVYEDGILTLTLTKISRSEEVPVNIR